VFSVLLFYCLRPGILLSTLFSHTLLVLLILVLPLQGPWRLAPPGCVPQPYRLIVLYPMLWKFSLAPPAAPTSTTTRETSRRERRNYGREITGNFADNGDFHASVGIFYMPQICDVGPTALLPLRRKAC
jgi:hypothetical protein